MLKWCVVQTSVDDGACGVWGPFDTQNQAILAKVKLQQLDAEKDEGYKFEVMPQSTDLED